MLPSSMRNTFGAIADLASILGLLISVIGFIVTILTVRKAKLAAEEAKQAAQQAFSKIKSQLLVLEIGSSTRLARGIDAACRDKNWGDVLSRCDEYRAQIARIKENDGLSSGEKQLLTASIKKIGELLAYVQSLREKRPQKEVSALKFEQLHDIIILLSEIEGRLQSDSMEIL